MRSCTEASHTMCWDSKFHAAGWGCGRRLGGKPGRQELLAPSHGQQGALAVLTVAARLQGQAQPRLRACSFCHLTDCHSPTCPRAATPPSFRPLVLSHLQNGLT